MSKIALVIGHNKKSKGAYSDILNISEFDFFTKVAGIVKGKFENIDTIERIDVGSYSREMEKVVSEVNSKNYDLVIELHYNAFNGSARGAEVLHFYKSAKGKEYATMFNDIMKAEGIPTRKNIPIENSGDRGGYGIVKARPVYILVEPFFGDNKQDCDIIKSPENFSDILIKFLEKVTGKAPAVKPISNIKEALIEVRDKIDGIIKSM